jgi:hypothetical protein
MMQGSILRLYVFWTGVPGSLLLFLRLPRRPTAVGDKPQVIRGVDEGRMRKQK